MFICFVAIGKNPGCCIEVLQEEKEPDFSDAPVALLTSGPDPFSCEKVFVIVEGNIILNDLPRISVAFMLLFGLTYALNWKCPQKRFSTFLW